jgi:hypothetical protein
MPVVAGCYSVRYSVQLEEEEVMIMKVGISYTRYRRRQPATSGGGVGSVADGVSADKWTRSLFSWSRSFTESSFSSTLSNMAMRGVRVEPTMAAWQQRRTAVPIAAPQARGKEEKGDQGNERNREAPRRLEERVSSSPTIVNWQRLRRLHCSWQNGDKWICRQLVGSPVMRSSPEASECRLSSDLKLGEGWEATRWTVIGSSTRWQWRQGKTVERGVNGQKEGRAEEGAREVVWAMLEHFVCTHAMAGSSATVVDSGGHRGESEEEVACASSGVLKLLE